MIFFKNNKLSNKFPFLTKMMKNNKKRNKININKIIINPEKVS